MAYAYQVTGSEDGTIAICGNRKRAIEMAIAYVQQRDSTYEQNDHENGYFSIYGDHLSACVEKWWLE
jgi:hypothetical protein